MLAASAIAAAGTAGRPLNVKMKSSPSLTSSSTNNYVTTMVPEVNRILTSYFPELESTYAHYPMEHSRWLDPKETGPKGEPCFIPIDQDNQKEEQSQRNERSANKERRHRKVKKDYTYCKDGPCGEGYYLLLCRHAYVNLYNRIQTMAPETSVCGCACNKATRKAIDDWYVCKRVLYARQACEKVPDDHVAAKLVLGRARDQDAPY